MTFPFLTAYDPPGTSEGTLDPLGLYQIADQLAVILVPAVRERMQRVRLLTAMAVGAVVTEDLDEDPTQRDASAYLVWEWLAIEAIVRTISDEEALRALPGRHMARRAIDQHGYLDARSYLKTPRIFGLNGVYKRLAVHLGLVDVHLAPGPNTGRLVDAWARSQGVKGEAALRPLLERWRKAIARSLAERPPRTKPSWNEHSWQELALALAPSRCRGRERRYLRELLLSPDEHSLGAFPIIWELQAEFTDDNFREEALHDRLEKRQRGYKPLLDAIRRYEAFGRALQDAFDVLRAEAARQDVGGFLVPHIVRDGEFNQSVKGLHERFATAYAALGDIGAGGTSLRSLFSDRFGAFAEPMDAGACALALCAHHESVQSAKSVGGKRPWFDRVGRDRIYVRHAYREARRPIEPGRYVHAYRGWPIRRFYQDLS